MILLPPELRAALRANAVAHIEAQRCNRREPDPLPVVKFFSPIGAATWLATELDAESELRRSGTGLPPAGG